MKKNSVVNLVLFASGSGSNAQRIIEHFDGHPRIRVRAIYCNNPGAYIIQRAAVLDIPCRIFSRDDLYRTGTVFNWLKDDEAELIVLAGFLWLIPTELVKAFPDRIINIHPALLPKYGGKGMYGMKVHEAVISDREKESGITIHLVDEEYDRGVHLLQTKIELEKDETPESLAEKIHKLEYDHFPLVIEKYIEEKLPEVP